MDIQINKPKKGDWSSITKLVLRCFPHHLMFPFLKCFYEHTFVAKSHGKIIGFVNTMNWLGRRGLPYINYVCVDMNYRGNGVGKRLLEFMLETLKEKYSEVYLKVSFRKKNTLSFYEKFGFELIEQSFLRMGYVMCLDF